MKFRTYVKRFLEIADKESLYPMWIFFFAEGDLFYVMRPNSDQPANEVLIGADSTEDQIWQAMLDLWRRHIQWPETSGCYLCQGIEYDTCVGPDVLHFTDSKPHKVLRLHETTSDMRFTRL